VQLVLLFLLFINNTIGDRAFARSKMFASHIWICLPFHIASATDFPKLKLFLFSRSSNPDFLLPTGVTLFSA